MEDIRIGKDFLKAFWNGKSETGIEATPLYVVKLGVDKCDVNGYNYVTLSEDGQLLACKKPDISTLRMRTSRICGVESGYGWVTFITASGSKYRVSDVLSRLGGNAYDVRYGFERNGETVYEQKHLSAKDTESANKIVEMECPYEVERVIIF